MTSRKRNFRSVAITLWVIAFFMHACFAQNLSDDDNSSQQYLHLIRASTLDLRPTEPFLLKLDYELYDLEGKPVEKGTVEESWGVEGSRIHTKSPTLQEEQPSAPELAIKTHNRESYLVRQVLDSLVHPLSASTKQINFAFNRFQQNFGSTDLDCFAIGLTDTRTPATPAYCTDANNRITVLTGGGPFVLRRNNFRKYRDREVPLDIELSYQGRVAMTAHVTELDVLPLENNKIPLIAGTDHDRLIRDTTLVGQILKKANPVYPKQARKKRIGGTVLLCAIITKAGTIAALDVVASPDPLFSQSATEAVQTWVYKPYLLKGVPTEVDTTIMVYYNVGH
jgi:TonB family protein